ncbi:uncharacterized protein LOC142163378 [Nicotiana tabacum]|uniref:Uncharacterized protein LOC142163378 n=1 Tax=Nicotiana tabacum TaxID=4097 RepID=A0AC58RVJ7_TOBAC
MAYFGETLIDIASEWYTDQEVSRWHIWDDLARDFVRQFQYNIHIAPDRNSLSNLKKRPSESFREYAVKWHEQAARVKPPMDETEMVSVFLQAQEADYYQNMMSALGKPFAEAIKIGEMVENGLKTGVVENLIEQKRIVLKDKDIPNVTNNPLPANNNGPIIGMICEDKEFDPILKAIIAIADIEKKPKTYVKQEKVDKKSKNPPQNTEKAVETKTEVVPSKDVILYVPRGSKKGQVTLDPPRRFELNKGSKMYVPKGTYAERGPIISPRLNEPVIIGRVPQRPMTDPTTVPWNYNKAVVTYKGKEILGEVNETNPTEKYLNLEELNDSTKKRFPLKKPKVLIKTLNEAYVPIETTVEQLERMAERFFMINQISFSKNDLPPEEAAHNKALHLTVKCEGYYMKRVMLDGGSGVDICPLSTLQTMEIKTGRIRSNSVLDMDTSYNFVLGRPWIHATEAIPSTLHQMVKFVYENQEIIVHGEEMIRHGYKLGKGLGASLQGITEPITLPTAEKFFGVGFYTEEADVMWENQRKSNGWVLSQPIPHLYRTFVRPKYNEEREDETFTTEKIVEICGVMRQMLYETHMVQPGEGSSTAEVLYMGPGAKLQNWKATPFPIKRESW